MHLAGSPPQISQSPISPIVLSPPQDPAIGFLPNITIPTLLLNAKNDSFLSSNSYPTEIAKNSKFLHLETPKHGGHVGYIQHNKAYYHEERALEFITQVKPT